MAQPVKGALESADRSCMSIANAQAEEILSGGEIKICRQKGIVPQQLKTA
jgi:hypothetical protein